MKICESCKKQPATVHLTDILNGAKKETHLCAQCAAAKGLDLSAAAALPNLLGKMAKGKARKASSGEGPTCPSCGMSWGEFRSKGRFGCARDYVVFRERLAEMLTEMHGRDPVHIGRAPEDFDRGEAAEELLNAAFADPDPDPAPDAGEPEDDEDPGPDNTVIQQLAMNIKLDSVSSKNMKNIMAMMAPEFGQPDGDEPAEPDETEARRNALRQRLEQAVAEERYEEAAALRDELKQLDDA